MADDLSVVNAARVSFAVRREEMAERDHGLIRFLMRDRHGTPFEHNSFRFHVRAPIFVAREWFRHRVGSFNEESARYHKLSPDFYVPEASAVRSQVGKPGAYTFEPVDDSLAESTRATLRRTYDDLYALYESLIDKGVAKEVARGVLPASTYTQFYWTINARSLMNFLSLRNADAAQYEIRVYAQALEHFFRLLMPATHESFLEFGRRAP
jgi:thymidylate synthase (FAD)